MPISPIIQHSLPSEFRVCGIFLMPGRPKIRSSSAQAWHEFLNHGYYAQELEREKILARLGPELTNDLYVNTSFRDIPPSGGAPT